MGKRSKVVILFYVHLGYQKMMFAIIILFPLTCHDLSPILLYRKTTTPQLSHLIRAAFSTKKETPFES